jgi:hypothetical protein
LRIVLEVLERGFRFRYQFIRLARGKRWINRAKQGNRYCRNYKLPDTLVHISPIKVIDPGNVTKQPAAGPSGA